MRIGFKEGKFIINPPEADLPTSDLDLVVAGTKDAILMVEAAANFLTEAQILEAIDLGHKEIKNFVNFKNKLEAFAVKKKNCT